MHLSLQPPLLRLPSLLAPIRHTAPNTQPCPSTQTDSTAASAPAATAVDPASVGMDRRQLHRAVDLVRRRNASAQLCVLRHGEVVLNEAVDCAPDSLFWMFSTTKPYTTTLVHLMAERGTVDLDERVATYWPEFGRHGKDRITLRHVLQHRTGFSTAGSPIRDLLSCVDWQQAVRAIEATRPRREPGGDPAYQFLIFGFILGEVLQRVTGRSFADLMRQELLIPLGVHDTHLGIGADEWPRQVPVVFRHLGGRVAAGGINRPGTRQAIMPSAGMSGTAYDTARFFQMLLAGGRVGGRQLIRPETIAAARTPSSTGERDRFCHTRIPWSYGFQLGGSRGPGGIPPFGYRSTADTFGHNGSNCCVAWADPDHDLAFAYLTNLRTHRDDDMAHLAAVADEVFAACR
ncbi:putative lipase LipE [Microlunatus endophyticus]|uniref:Lipase LipE n=1 Tax=Microlunatus endophyticus TaxID=1716077 RepID=A0A917W6N0_9ACTN|nr:serine hydrolase domain-containing protein [Microlunatus endophyticus]GGL75528.1 putative lipase LipE [Microlunatus endophyticus]